MAKGSPRRAAGKIDARLDADEDAPAESSAVESSAAAGKPSSAEVARRVRDEILVGRLPAGHRLTEAELTKRFAIGRGLAREAIQQLAHQGLLVTKRNCGALVAPEAPKAVRDLIVPIRRTIEVYALRLVFDELTDADFERWEEVLSDMRAACRRKDLPAIAESDIAFHRLLLERANQPDLLVIWETLVGRIRMHFRRTQSRIARALDIFDEHRELLDAFRGDDERAAVRLLEEKID